MRIGVTKVMNQLDGKTPIKHPDGTDATFRSVVTEVMAFRFPEDGKELKFSVRCFEIAQKVHNADTVDLSVDDLAFIKERVAKMGYSHFVIGRMHEIIENAMPMALAAKE